MKLLVTGAGGMLGQALSACLQSRGHNVISVPKEKLDVTNYNQCLETIEDLAPDLIIHCGAYTKVDQAESEPNLAYHINGYGTENLAVACNIFETPMLYFSSDYVFDGEQNQPYTPWDATRPLSIYGKSKLAGEKAVQRHLQRFYIVRTSWLYGPNGKNFVDTISSMANDRKTLRVVSDQIGSPTCTLSLSETVADLITTGRWGVYHGTDDGVTSWYEFAKEILRDRDNEVIPIATSEMPRPATRPKYSVLDKTTLINTIGRELPPWQESLKTYLQLHSGQKAAATSG
ncbi:MAG: dTDP-4-dehydrorhamnose reductase [Cyanobacteria bacterium SZAS LIN-5]|nr:dTDP-4-dehydrorhamnose reductase [Cyanobacteria bacterium SZAS LIN-5]RTL37760.1 MAG: dTDP-4-dehydrorhamnose reductase [Candidatus Melainabacteria bacterium]